MTCCDSWGRCTRAPGCAAGSVPAPAHVAPVKAHYRRVNDLDGYMSRPAPLEIPVADDAQAIEHDLRALVSLANAPGQRGSVWFAEPEPTTELRAMVLHMAMADAPAQPAHALNLFPVSSTTPTELSP